MAYEVKFMGLSKDKLELIGRVVEEPAFLPYGEGECAILQVKTVRRNMGANGQWTDEVNVVPVTVISEKQVQTVKDYVKPGRQVMIDAYVKTWEVNGAAQSANMMLSLSLGDKPYEAEDAKVPETGGGSNLPPI